MQNKVSTAGKLFGVRKLLKTEARYAEYLQFLEYYAQNKPRSRVLVKYPVPYEN